MALLHYFAADSSLTFHDLRVIERRDECLSMFFGIDDGCRVGCIEGVAGKDNLDVFLSEHPHLLDLLLWSCHWHEDGTHDLELAA